MTPNSQLTVASDGFDRDWSLVRLVSELRLAAIALVIVALVFESSSTIASIKSLGLIGFVLYFCLCAAEFAPRLRTSAQGRLFNSRMIWFDVVAFLTVLAATDASVGVVITALLCCILVVSCCHGFRAGLWTTCSLGAALMIGYLVEYQAGSGAGASRLLLSAAAITTIGGVISKWGAEQRSIREGIHLLRRISTISNPRFGIERTLEGIVTEFQQFYKADTCFLALRQNDRDLCSVLRSSGSAAQGQPGSTEAITRTLAEKFLSFSNETAFVYSRRHTPFSRGDRYIALDGGHIHSSAGERTSEGAVADLLDVRSLMSAPFTIGHDVEGRFYIASKNRSRFDEKQLQFLVGAIETFQPIIEKVRLVDRLAGEAAEHERKRIARDIHDTTIQPFIGLKLGLNTVRAKLEEGSADVREDVARLLAFTEGEILELRKYVSGLKGEQLPNTTLVDAVQAFIRKFSDLSGINVRLTVDPTLKISDRLAAEVFQLVTEGLSNVRRHTGALNAEIQMGCSAHYFNLKVRNDANTTTGPSREFRPKSISERAAALGGEVVVLSDEAGFTQLHVSIPL
jgi:signal transduction histidine kinase